MFVSCLIQIVYFRSLAIILHSVGQAAKVKKLIRKIHFYLILWSNYCFNCRMHQPQSWNGLLRRWSKISLLLLSLPAESPRKYRDVQCSLIDYYKICVNKFNIIISWKLSIIFFAKTTSFFDIFGTYLRYKWINFLAKSIVFRVKICREGGGVGFESLANIKPTYIYCHSLKKISF